MEKYLLLAIVALAITGTGLFFAEENKLSASNNAVYQKFVQWKSVIILYPILHKILKKHSIFFEF